MSRRTLLSAEQRARLFGIPMDAAEMAKHYVLSPEDLALIGTKRRSGNRLGFAVQLCLLRHPGQGLGFGEHPPKPMIAFVARQIGASPHALADYALRDQTRREHVVELQKLLGLRSFRWRTGTPARRSAPTPPGRLTAASRSCTPCLHTYGPSACSSGGGGAGANRARRTGPRLQAGVPDPGGGTDQRDVFFADIDPCAGEPSPVHERGGKATRR